MRENGTNAENRNRAFERNGNGMGADKGYWTGNEMRPDNGIRNRENGMRSNYGIRERK